MEGVETVAMSCRTWSSLVTNLHARLLCLSFANFLRLFVYWRGKRVRRGRWRQNRPTPLPPTPSPTRAALPYNTANSPRPAHSTQAPSWPLQETSAPTAQAQMLPLLQQCRSFPLQQRVPRLACRPRSRGLHQAFVAKHPTPP